MSKDSWRILTPAEKEKLIAELESEIQMHENEINKLQKRIKELSK